MRKQIAVLVGCLLLPLFAAGQEIDIRPITPELTAEDLTPRITIDEAIAVAREFVKTNAIDVSEHYLSSARFLISPAPRTPARSRREWIVMWEHPTVFRDDIILFVNMKKEVINWTRWGRQQPDGEPTQEAAQSATP